MAPSAPILRRKPFSANSSARVLGQEGDPGHEFLGLAVRQQRRRIGDRIQTEQQGGVDMDGAISLFATADSDIASATAAVNALAAYMPAASSTITASTTIDLDMARNLDHSAQMSIEKAQKDLGGVVSAIAKAMGLQLGEGSSTAESSTTTQ